MLSSLILCKSKGQSTKSSLLLNKSDLFDVWEYAKFNLAVFLAAFARGGHGLRGWDLTRTAAVFLEEVIKAIERWRMWSGKPRRVFLGDRWSLSIISVLLSDLLEWQWCCNSV